MERHRTAPERRRVQHARQSPSGSSKTGRFFGMSDEMYELPNLNRVAAVQSPRISGKGTAVNSIVRSFGWNSRGDRHRSNFSWVESAAGPSR